MGVDFSSTVSMEYYTLVVPLVLKDNDLSFLQPLTYEVWIASIVVTPVTIITMGLLDLLIYNHARWMSIVDFVLRSAVFQHGQRLNDEQNYQKILSVFWLWSASVLTFAYSGNLMAMITRPSLHLPINNVDEMLQQGVNIKSLLRPTQTANLIYPIRDHSSDQTHVIYLFQQQLNNINMA